MFIEKRTQPSEIEEALRRIADTRELVRLEAEHGLTVASVQRYILDHIGE
jgi:hypothetical protein